MHCYFCDKHTDNVETAIADDWAPSYWIDNEEIYDAVCGECFFVFCEPEEQEIEL